MENANGFDKNKKMSDNDRIVACCERIKEKITDARGKSDFIEEEGWVALAGTKEAPKLLLTVSVLISGGRHWLIADIDGRAYWQEQDYESIDEFENAVVNYAAPMIGRTVKTVTERKKHKYVKISRYYLEGEDKWAPIDENVFDSFPIRLFTFKNAQREEIRRY